MMLAGFGQDLGKYQFDRFAVCQKTLTVLVRQGRKQTIGNRYRIGWRHITLLLSEYTSNGS